MTRIDVISNYLSTFQMLQKGVEIFTQLPKVQEIRWEGDIFEDDHDIQKSGTVYINNKQMPDFIDMYMYGDDAEDDVQLAPEFGITEQIWEQISDIIWGITDMGYGIGDGGITISLSKEYFEDIIKGIKHEFSIILGHQKY